VGAKAEDFNESVKRTTDDKPSANERFSRRFTDLIIFGSRNPALKRWATFTQSASRTRAELLLQQSHVRQDFAFAVTEPTINGKNGKHPRKATSLRAASGKAACLFLKEP